MLVRGTPWYNSVAMRYMFIQARVFYFKYWISEWLFGLSVAYSLSPPPLQTRRPYTTMVVERDEKWMPQFEPGARRSVQPSSTAPVGRRHGGGSVVAASADSIDDDDEASSSLIVTNRCSPKSVFSLVSKLSEFKKQLVRDTGFGGILEIPSISKLNLKLSSWLLCKLDTEESCLVVGPSRQIYVHEDDVGIVLGIPNGEIDISTTSVTDEQLELLRSSIGLVGSDVRSIKGIEYVLEKHLDDQSSSQEIDSFKVAFVVFIVAHLLAPCVKHDQVHLDFWGALKNPSSLDRYNWCLLTPFFDMCQRR